MVRIKSVTFHTQCMITRSTSNVTFGGPLLLGAVTFRWVVTCWGRYFSESYGITLVVFEVKNTCYSLNTLSLRFCAEH